MKGVGFSLRRRIQMALCAQYSPICLMKLMGHCPPREAVTQLRKVHKPTKWTIQQPISFSAAHLEDRSLSYTNANKQWTKRPANSVQHSRSSAATSLSLEQFIHWITNCTGQSLSHTYIHSLTQVRTQGTWVIPCDALYNLSFDIYIFVIRRRTVILTLLLYLQFYIHTYILITAACIHKNVCGEIRVFLTLTAHTYDLTALG